MPSPSDAPYWLQLVQPFGTVFLGLGAFFLGWRQRRTAHEKFRLDIFDRRVAAIHPFKGNLSSLRRNKSFHSDEITKISDDVIALDLLYGDMFNDRINEIYILIEKRLDESLSALGREDFSNDIATNEALSLPQEIVNAGHAVAVRALLHARVKEPGASPSRI